MVLLPGGLLPLVAFSAERYHGGERVALAGLGDDALGKGGIHGSTGAAAAGMPRGTWKPYRVAYEVIKALRPLDTGSVVEVITKDDKGLLNDLGIWCQATGYELLDTQRSKGEARLLIRKGEPVRNDRTMTVIMSTASLQAAVYPLDKALARRGPRDGRERGVRRRGRAAAATGLPVTTV